MIFKLDLSDKGYLQRKDISQYDDRTLTIHLFSHGEPFIADNKSITLEAKNQNNNVVIQNSNISKSGNIVSVDIVKDITRISGTVDLKLILVENNKRISTFKFGLNVDSSVTTGSTVVPGIAIDVIETLQNKIVEATLVKDQTEKLIKEGGAATPGDILTQTNKKVDKVEGKGLSANDYTNTDKEEVAKVKDKADITEVTNLKQSIDNIKANGIIPTTQNAVIGTTSNPFKEIFLGEINKGESGYTTLPNGLILQWGKTMVDLTGGVDMNYTTVTLPIPFKTAMLSVSTTLSSTTADKYYVLTNAQMIDNTKFYVSAGVVREAVGANVSVYWLALGY